MLPYHELQAAYVVGSAAPALLAWWALARSRALARRGWLRLLAAMAAVAALAFAGLVLFPTWLDLHDARGFGVVAVTLYADALWLPLLALGSAVRARRGGGRAEPLLVVLALAAPALALYGLLVEPNRLQVRRERVRFEAWPAGRPPLRVVHLSDLQTVGACERERDAVRRIRALEPDLIVFTGDYVAGPFGDPEPAIAAARAFFAALEAPLGVYAVGGHAEPERLRRRVLAGLDVRYLDDASERIELPDGRALELHGLSVGSPALELVGAGGRTAGASRVVRLVLSHEPGVSARLVGRGVDLHLAGHTHGGQVVLPGFGPPLTLSSLPRRFARGLHRFGDHWLNVSAGLGMEGNHAPRVRLFCPPEICVVELAGSG